MTKNSLNGKKSLTGNSRSATGSIKSKQKRNVLSNFFSRIVSYVTKQLKGKQAVIEDQSLRSNDSTKKQYAKSNNIGKSSRRRHVTPNPRRRKSTEELSTEEKRYFEKRYGAFSSASFDHEESRRSYSNPSSQLPGKHRHRSTQKSRKQ